MSMVISALIIIFQGLQVTGYRLRVTGYRLQVTGYRLLVMGLLDKGTSAIALHPISFICDI